MAPTKRMTIDAVLEDRSRQKPPAQGQRSSAAGGPAPSRVKDRRVPVLIVAGSVLLLGVALSVALENSSRSIPQLPTALRVAELVGATAPVSGEALPIAVLRASQPEIATPPATTLNVTANFEAAAPVERDCSLVVYLIDSSGKAVADFHNDLNDTYTILPTSRWNGPVTLTQSIQVPKLADGVYSIRVSLEGWKGTMRLRAGPGVSADQHGRYAIGTLRVSAAAPPPSLLPPATLNLTGYKLTFDDEFRSLSISDATKFDGARWYTHNKECCMQTTDGTSTAMARRASPNNPFVHSQEGGLAIRLQERDHAWTSGVITSVDNAGVGFSQQYGYFEMKAKFPKGENTWPAFWLMNTAEKSRHAAPGEIDVVEYIANPKFPNYIATTLHDWTDQSTPAASHYRVPLPTEGFHTYGMMWTERSMTFYFDGAAMFETPTPSIMMQPYYMLLDLGIGSGYPTERTPPVNDMEIEYVRVYEKQAGGGE